MLRRVHIQNYRCFGDFELLPQNLTLLFGRNGSGKSTLMNVLWSLREFVVEGESVDATELFDGAQETPVTLELDLELSAGMVRYRLVVDRGSDPKTTLCVFEESVTQLADGAKLFVFREGMATWTDGVKWTSPHRRDMSALSAFPFVENESLVELKEWFDGVWMLRLAPQSMHDSADEKDPGLAVDGENFVAWLLSFETGDSIADLGPDRPSALLDKVSEALRPVLDGFDGLKWVLAGRDVVLAAHFTHSKRKLVDFGDLSDGQRCLIVLYSVLVLVDDVHLLLLDEPDSHVTSVELAPLLSAIRKRTDALDLQAIVASHHPQVIDVLASEDPWELVDGPGGVVARPFEVARLKGLPASRHLLLRGRRGN